MVEESGKSDRVRIISFNESVLEKAKQQLPAVPCYLLRFHVPRKSYAAFVSRLDRMNLDGADLFHGTITPELVTLLNSRGYTVISWTVDSLRTARRLISYGVTGITTNVAGWFNKKLRD
jgi:glycerophosphoryl diester phosphodiesterase